MSIVSYRNLLDANDGKSNPNWLWPKEFIYSCNLKVQGINWVWAWLDPGTHKMSNDVFILQLYSLSFVWTLFLDSMWQIKMVASSSRAQSPSR